MSKNKESLDNFLNHDLYTDTRTIWFSCPADEDGIDCDIDADTARTIIKSLHVLAHQSKEPITIMMNSKGGDVGHAMAIYDAIRACPCQVTIQVMGHAWSMAAVILQAADKRVLQPSATVMVHDGQFGVTDVPPKTFEAWGRYSKKSRHEMYEILADRTGKSSTYWKKKCSHDYFMNAWKAVQEGLADDIMEPAKWTSFKKSTD
jgi:ATP-dependent Clp protease protease subunit